MPIQAKKWYEKLFELLILFGLAGVAYYILKKLELGSISFYIFLAFGFAYLYINVENLKIDLKYLSQNVEDNFGQIFPSLHRKYDSIESLESEIFNLKLANENLANQIADLRYEIYETQSKQ